MENQKIALKNFTEEELKEFMKEIGEKPIHGYTKVQKLLMI